MFAGFPYRFYNCNENSRLTTDTFKWIYLTERYLETRMGKGCTGRICICKFVKYFLVISLLVETTECLKIFSFASLEVPAPSKNPSTPFDQSCLKAVFGGPPPGVPPLLNWDFSCCYHPRTPHSKMIFFVLIIVSIQ